MTNVVKPYAVGIICFLVLMAPISVRSQAPLALEPAQSSVIADRTPLFVFTECSDCRIELDDMDDFMSPELEIDGIIGDSLEVTGDLQDGTYFWRIREGIGPWSEVKEFRLFDIGSLSSLNQWLIADSISANLGDLIGDWNDLSSQGFDMVQALPDGQPELVDSELNGKRALRFDGADLLNGGDIHDLLDGSLNIYVVHRATELTYTLLGKGRGVNDEGAYSVFPASGNYRFLTRGVNLVTAIGPLSNTLDQYSILSCILDRPASDIRVDVNSAVGNSSALLNYPDFIDNDFDFIIGAYTETYQFPFSGDIAEILVFDTVLTTEQDSLVERYLRFRYSPPIQLGPDRELEDLCSLELDASGAQYVSHEWSDGTTADTLVVQSPGIYHVTVTDIFGSVSSDTLEVSIPGTFLSGDTILCSGSEILWETGLSTEDFTFIWQDGSTDSSFLISEPGSYHVQVDRVDGCTYQSDTLFVTLDDFPISASLGDDVELCAGNTISLVMGQEEAEDYLWNDEPGFEELVINESGVYWVEATNGNGCVAQDTISVTVLGLAPLADFFFENLCFGETVEFTDTSIPLGGSEIVEWNWDFGDGQGTIGTDVTHLYNETDTFQVSLTILTDVGCSDDQTYEVVISPLPIPAFSNGLACSGQPIIFTDESTVSTGGISEASWRFDGLAFANGPTATFVYPDVGSFQTRLVVTTLAGCQDSSFLEIFVNGSPVSDFISENVCIGEPTPFTADPDGSLSGPIEQFFWDFGSSTSIFEVTSYTFPTPGPQEVSLTVTSAFGCTHDTTKTVIVSNDPQAGFFFDQSCVDSPIVFNDTTVAFEGDPIDEWAWFFDSLGESEDSSPSFTFTEADTYTVTLDVTSEAGCSDQVQQDIQVNPLPTSFFSFSPLLGEAPFTPAITNESAGASSYLWSFDMGVTSTEMDPVHTFLDSGLVEVSLLVTNDFGCSDLYTDLILLTPPQTDLILESLDCIIDGDFLRPVLGIRNLSNHRVTEMDIRAEIVEGSILVEDWEGILEPDAALILPMNSSLFYDSEELPFLCVEILPQAPYLEDKAIDNSICKTIGEGEPEVFWLPPSPNPAIDRVSIRVINARQEPLRIECFDMVGRRLIDEERSIEEGLVEDIELDVSALKAGRYLIRLTQGLTDEVFKLQILR